MLFSPKQKRSFLPVAIMVILIGAGIFAYGFMIWLVNMIGNQNFFSFPSLKIIGGLVIMSLGYIQLELEMLRQK
ncbi:MAG: hypothetical protein WCW17_02160 [Patescibacteria group bacterium]|jgi:hypothetical protein